MTVKVSVYFYIWNMIIVLCLFQETINHLWKKNRTNKACNCQVFFFGGGVLFCCLDKWDGMGGRDQL